MLSLAVERAWRILDGGPRGIAVCRCFSSETMRRFSNTRISHQSAFASSTSTGPLYLIGPAEPSFSRLLLIGSIGEIFRKRAKHIFDLGGLPWIFMERNTEKTEIVISVLLSRELFSGFRARPCRASSWSAWLRSSNSNCPPSQAKTYRRVCLRKDTLKVRRAGWENTLGGQGVGGSNIL